MKDISNEKTPEQMAEETQKLRDQLAEKQDKIFEISRKHRPYGGLVVPALVEAYEAGVQAAQKEIEAERKDRQESFMYTTMKYDESCKRLHDQLTASNARCEELEAVLKNTESDLKMCEMECDDLRDLERDLASSNARAARYEKAFRLYSKHSETCYWIEPEDRWHCTCGLTKALAYDSEGEK